MSNRAGIFCGDQWYQMDQLCTNSPYRNSDFFINDFFKKPLFRQLFSGGIRVRTLYRQKTREIERVMILRICHGILTSFFIQIAFTFFCHATYLRGHVCIGDTISDIRDLISSLESFFCSGNNKKCVKGKNSPRHFLKS